jgi:plastocyanin
LEEGVSVTKNARATVSALPIGLIAVAGVATACGGGAAPGPTSPSPPSVSQPAGAVTATLSDFRIALSSQNFRPGAYTFHAVNAGHTVHSLEINGPGVADKTLPSTLNPGQSGDVGVSLQPGNYEIYCPVDGHKDAGMDVTITVPSGSTGSY